MIHLEIYSLNGPPPLSSLQLSSIFIMIITKRFYQEVLDSLTRLSFKYMNLSVHTSSNGKPNPDQTDQNDQNIEGKNANENISATSGILVFSTSFFVALF